MMRQSAADISEDLLVQDDDSSLRLLSRKEVARD
jgi:hypothetical protein